MQRPAGRRLAFPLAAWTLLLTQSLAAAAVVYGTSFERAGGYDPVYTLDGQQGWLGDGTGGNGVNSNLFLLPEYGQQAYVGFYEPLVLGEPSLTVWRPLSLASVAVDAALVRLSVWMMIIDSSEYLSYDRFQWSVFATNGSGTYGLSTNGTRLFTIDFNNWDRTINYELQDSSQFTPSQWSFENDAFYHLQVLMDFARNRWSASLTDTVVVTNQPISTSPGPVSLGAIAAVWVYRDTNYAGDNFMAFDDYEVTQDGSELPRLSQGERSGNSFSLRLEGQPGRRYAIEATTDFDTWTPLRTNTVDISGGSFDFIDRNASTARRSYRGRLVP
jgi:hypothetical protein